MQINRMWWDSETVLIERAETEIEEPWEDKIITVTVTVTGCWGERCGFNIWCSGSWISWNYNERLITP